MKISILLPYKENYSKNYIEIEDFGDQTLLKLLRRGGINKLLILKKIIKLLGKLQLIRQRKVKDFKKKITIEALWNQLIYSKFKSKVNIDTKKIKSEIVNNKNNKVTLFNLSEIIFNIDQDQTLEIRFEQIKNDIDLNGFENAAVIHSISDTGSTGGKLGWINQNSINQKLNEKIKNINEMVGTAV